MGYPKENQIVYGIVCGGDSEDPDPSMSGGYKVHIPTQYGSGVNSTQLPFSRGLAQATQEGVTRFNPPPERGTGVIALKTTGHSGSGECIVLGTVAGELATGGTISGNFSLGSIIQEFVNHQTEIKIPPNIQEVVENGAQIRKIVEKGIQHSNGLLQGLPTNGAIPNMLGIPLKELTNISTAIEQFSNILPADIASKLPGKSFNISDIFNQIPSGIKSEIFSALPSELGKGLENMTTLMQSIESSTGAGFMTGGKVDPDTFISNAIDLFKDVDNIKSISDIANIFQKLQLDTSLRGLENLSSNVFDIDTPFGKIQQSIDAFGNITNLIPDQVQQALQALSSLMGNASSFTGSIPEIPMFGDASQIISELQGRVPPDLQGLLKNLTEIDGSSLRNIQDLQKLTALKKIPFSSFKDILE